MESTSVLCSTAARSRCAWELGIIPQIWASFPGNGRSEDASIPKAEKPFTRKERKARVGPSSPAISSRDRTTASPDMKVRYLQKREVKSARGGSVPCMAETKNLLPIDSPRRASISVEAEVPLRRKRATWRFPTAAAA